MPVVVWNTQERETKFNDEIAASGNELIIDGTTNVEKFNMLFVQNFDANSDIEIRLDDVSASSPLEKFIVQKNGGFLNIGPDLRIDFTRVFIVNRNASAVVANDSVLVRCAKVTATTQAVQGEATSFGATQQFGIITG